MSAPEYTQIEFSFHKPSGRRNGKSYEVTAYLLVPAAALAELQAWSETPEASRSLSNAEMYESLLAKGALLHREDGAAYKEVEKSAFDRNHAVVTSEQYWENGVQKGAGGGPRIRTFGR